MPGTITFNADDEEYAWVSLKGHPLKVAQVLEDVSRPGADGQAYRRRGKRGPTFPMEGFVDCDTLAAAEALYDGLRDRQGTLCAVVTDRNGSYPNVMLLEVGPPEIRPVITGTPRVSGSCGATLRVQFLMQCTQ